MITFFFNRLAYFEKRLKIETSLFRASPRYITKLHGLARHVYNSISLNHIIKFCLRMNILTFSLSNVFVDVIPQSMQDLLCMNNDFPPRAHCLVRW